MPCCTSVFQIIAGLHCYGYCPARAPSVTGPGLLLEASYMLGRAVWPLALGALALAVAWRFLGGRYRVLLANGLAMLAACWITTGLVDARAERDNAAAFRVYAAQRVAACADMAESQPLVRYSSSVAEACDAAADWANVDRASVLLAAFLKGLAAGLS